MAVRPTKRQRAFVKAYRRSGDAKESARLAGYSASVVKHAKRVLSWAGVKTLLEKARGEPDELVGGVDLNGTYEQVVAGLAEQACLFTTPGDEARPLLRGGEIDLAECRRRVAEELWGIATADIGDYAEVDEDGVLSFKPLGQLSAQQRRTIALLRQPGGASGRGSIEVKQFDKLRALYILSRILGLYSRPLAEETEDLEVLERLLERGGDG